MMNGTTTEDGKTVSKSKFTMKKILIGVVIVVLFLIAVIGLTLFLVISSDRGPCNSVGCVQAASDIISYIDPSVKPCHDFYQFTCGKYLERAKREDFKTIEDDTAHKMEQDFISMIEEPIHRSDSYSTKLMKTFFHSCLNETLVDITGLRKMKWLLNQVGGWPILDGNGWSEKQFDWRKTLIKLRDMGAHFSIFFDVDYKRREDDEDKRIINIDNRIFRKYQDRKMQHEFMVDIAIIFGATRPVAERDFNGVLNFHAKLVEATNYTDDSNFPSYNPKTLREVNLMYPSVNWTELLSSILYPNAINLDEVVNIEDAHLMPRILEIINNTPKRTIANYMLWYVIQSYMGLLPERIRERQSKYMSSMYNIPEVPREETCFEYLQQRLSTPALLQYFKIHYPHNVRRDLRRILNIVKDEYKDEIDAFNWLDVDSKKIIKQKFAGSQDYVTFDEFLDTKNIFGVFDDVRINETDPLDSILKLNLATLNSEADFGLTMSSFVSHDPKSNKIVLVPIHTQGIYYNVDRPQYMNYGAMGSSIAYHLSDILLEGKNYDLNGQPRQWSTSESLVNYDEKLNCLTNQYKKIYVPEINGYLRTSETRKKDFAYFISRHIAYKAYTDWIHENGPEQELPGLAFTPKQLFWIASAMTQCSKAPEEYVRREMSFSGMPPARLRVNGPLRNSEAFANDFNCPSDAKMNPEEKCSV